MKINHVLFCCIMSLVFMGLTSCMDGVKKKKPAKFVHPDLPNERVNKIKSKGVGKTSTIQLSDTINVDLAKKGKFVFEKRCASCHKLTDQRLVGPGWENITNSRRPEWILNMITNTNEMLEKDSDAKMMLDDCLTRMPNQNLTEEEARAVLEFMRQNDLERVQVKDGAVEKPNE
ncbi:c-type cytochrome [Formosa sp. 3Alg 14/1]|uniref:c-type cytochrome n=1 Tax=Formosa sp. 3Alg 14/1 TaxID=3382190 RepID=UPI0039BEB71C